MTAPVFYTGTHRPGWLETSAVPLFVSERTLGARKRLPRARCRWALDSGGFTELLLHGRHRTPARAYAARVARYVDEVGGLDFAAIQDWMCEPGMLELTGLSVDEHQRRTVDSYLELRALAPRLPWLPVVQGWQVGDYWRCVELYDRAGVDLAALPRVGVGSICRRQGTVRAGHVLASLAADGLKLHAFGVKRAGLASSAQYLASADSMAWSYRERRKGSGLSNDQATAERWGQLRTHELAVLEQEHNEALERWQNRASYGQRARYLDQHGQGPGTLELARTMLLGA